MELRVTSPMDQQMIAEGVVCQGHMQNPVNSVDTLKRAIPSLSPLKAGEGVTTTDKAVVDQHPSVQEMIQKDPRGVLLGMLFGDGNIYLNKSRWNYGYLRVNHCASQRPYAEYKAVVLQKIFGGAAPKVSDFDNSGYPGVRFEKGSRYFKNLRNWLYAGGQKRITRHLLDWLNPLGIAIWYMDDGGLGIKKRNGRVHAVDLYINCHTDIGNATEICQYFRERWGINFTPNLNHGKYRIRAGTKEARKFVGLFGSFLIPEMEYKISILKQCLQEPRNGNVRDSLNCTVLQ